MSATLTDEQIEDIYSQLKEYGERVRTDRRLDGPEADSVTVRSRMCGSELTLDAVIVDQRVQQLGYAVRACSLGQATTGIVTRHLGELDAARVHRVAQQLQDILHGKEVACDWPELDIFSFAQDIPVRHDSALLVFRALEVLFRRAAGARGVAAGAIPGSHTIVTAFGKSKSTLASGHRSP